jgi:hypothetical protein
MIKDNIDKTLIVAFVLATIAICLCYCKAQPTSPKGSNGRVCNMWSKPNN